MGLGWGLAWPPARSEVLGMASFWSSLKHEPVYPRKFTTRNEAATTIVDYIEGVYHRTRLHSALGFKSPLDY